MRKLISLRTNERGAAAIEMAIGVPVLAVFLYGIFQVGVAFQASSGMQHALGEGARYATLCINPTPTGCSSPSNAQIQQRINDKVFGTGVGIFSQPTVTNGPTGSGYKTLSVTFTMGTNFLLFEGPDITMTRTKRVYVAGGV